MAIERIDIEVTDKVDPSAAKKMHDIADGADRAQKYLTRLKSALASVNTTALDRLASAMSKADTAQAKLLNAQARLTSAQNAGSIAAEKVALAQQKLATESARTQAAQQRAAQATANAQSAAMRLQAAQARAGAATAQATSATQGNSAATAAAAASAASAASRVGQLATAQGQQAAASGKAASALDNYIAGLNSTNNAADRYLRVARQNTAVNANLVAQFQDIGVSLAGGQNPLLVLIQQGSQISYIASTIEGGYSGVAKAVLSWFVVQKAANTEAVKSTAFNLAQARSAEAVVIAEARKAETAAAVLVAQRALTVAQGQVTIAEQTQAVAAAELTAATAALEAAQLSASGSAGRSAAAQNALTAALARQAAANEAATVASAQLATARVAQASAATGVAAAESSAASAIAGSARALSGLSIGLIAVLAVAGPTALALSNINKEANASAGLDNYVKSLGLTAKETKRLEDVTVTAGDTMSAAWEIVTSDLLSLFGISTEGIKKLWTDTVDFVLYWSRMMVVGIYGLVSSLLTTIGQVVSNIPILFKNAGIAAKNLFLMSIELMINTMIDGINQVSRAVNLLSEAAGFGKVVGELEKWNLGVSSVSQGMSELVSVTPIDNYIDRVQEADRYTRGLGDRIKQQAIENAKIRLKGQADEILSNRSGGASAGGGSADGISEEAKALARKADALSKLNLELDNELERMKLLKGEREIQGRMDQITESLAQKKIALDEKERMAIEAKVKAIHGYKEVQSEMDRIYDEATRPLIAYTATLKAANELYGRGAISAEQQRREIAKASMVYQEAIDPLLNFTLALEARQRTMGVYGRELARANYLESIRQALVAQGYTGDALANELASKRVKSLIAQNDALLQQQYIQSQAASFIDPAMEQNNFIQNYQSIYDEINRLRQEDVENEKVYQQALYSLQAKYNEMRLGALSSFFGTMAQVTSKGHGAIGAISKAAAIAQATIDGYVAVQKALASLPPPFNYAAAAAVAVQTGAQIAGIVSTNVGSFATGGQFIVDGKSGVDANNINMNVTRGERVTIETPAQQRRSGANIEIHNYSSAKIETQEASDGTIRLIVREELDARVPAINRKELSDPNSDTSRALRSNFKVDSKF